MFAPHADSRLTGGRIRAKRLLAALALALSLAPGTFIRTELPQNFDDNLYVEAVSDLPETVSANGFRREGVWHLTSPNIEFGGYSALLVPGAGKADLWAFSDRGSRLILSAPDGQSRQTPRLSRVGNRGRLRGTIPDIEAAAHDESTGSYWLAFENSNAIIRYSVASELEALREPPEWRDWPANSGAEAMERLPDGRFIVLQEASNTGLVFDGDPTGDVASFEFRYELPGDYAATDLATLPDGRVLILLRRLAFGYPPFTAALAIGDPRDLAAGHDLPISMLVNLDTLLPRENYEGLAIAPQDDGAIVLWIIADDNRASFQRTLLAKLVWAAPDAHEKAREEIPRAPSNP
ncbi:hypothetical protein CP97_00985 [Aurantiacibacter atlanticus]|uniref:Phytase-like domain-containing protein n=1 Tax=Aurantiacibacter atlanticus TaxID=1648404 RepID=A0A0H4V8I9_9SPHN|nr:esterase-like activity of phytase family protein [Aurantiacibacter atlanticus]AKQ40927.2 hypothetical protein CP97_00985 [Aurantiacibacter atlanticus]MDF1833528.1 esterase-like activity of phytase family protein [Alteraurantiacibacter sp. bin_em_oilr2.035]